MIRTFSPTPKDLIPTWHLFDAQGQVIGRLASRVAPLLMGKHKTSYAPHMHSGDHVVIINAAKIKSTGRKETQKKYYHYSGYPGGLTTTPLEKLRLSHPDRILKFAVSGMLPKNKLRDRMLRNLHIFVDSMHPYQDKFKSN